MKKLTPQATCIAGVQAKLSEGKRLEREREKNQGDIFVWVVVVVSGSRQIDRILCLGMYCAPRE